MTYEQFKEKWAPNDSGHKFGNFTRDLTALCVGYQTNGYNNGVSRAMEALDQLDAIAEILGHDN